MNYTYSEEVRYHRAFQQPVRKFKPLIIFHHKDDILQDETGQRRLDDENQRNLIEQHRLKTINMMRHNAYVWENGGFDHSSAHPDKPQSYSHRAVAEDSSSIVSSNHDENNEHQYTKRKYSHNLLITPFSSSKDMLEPQTQTSIPPPLYHSKQMNSSSQKPLTSRADSTSISTFQNNPSNDRKRSIDNSSSDTMIGTTFIAEPQFHHVYKPQLNRKRRRGNLPKKVTEFLKQWLILHKKHPYPTEREKQKLADETGLMVSQISNWFINARRRILQPLLESESHLASTSGSQENTSMSHSLFNTPDDGDRILASIDDSDNRHDFEYYYYESDQYNQLSGESSNMPMQLDRKDDTLNQEKNKGKNQVPPPWVSLPAKLPSMNILEKDLGAFKPKE